MMQFKKSLHSKLKRMAALTLTVAMTVTSFSFVHTENAYAASFNMGSENHWAESFMRNLYNRGLMSGDKNGNMNPDKPITRAEFISIINRTFGYTKTGKTPFKDIKGTEWYAKDIAIAYNQGYFSGDGKGTANAKGLLTREQAIALLGRNLQIEEMPGASSSFSDNNSIANWSRGFVNTSASKGFISGYRDNTFRPGNNITRAEVAKVLTDAVGELVNHSGTRTLGTQNGNVTIAASGVTLKDTVVRGDLYITGGVGLGSTVFDNVLVLGEVIVNGTGESQAGKSSITFKDCTITNLIIPDTKGTIKSIKLTGNTIVDETLVKTNAYLEEMASKGGGFKNVVLNGPAKTALHLAGLFDKVTMKGPQNNLYVDKDTVENLVIDEEAVNSKVFLDSNTYVNGAYLDVGVDISGTGEIGYLKVNSAGSKIEMLPDDIEVRPGLTANVKGKNMTSKDADEASSGPKILVDYPEMEDVGPGDAVAKFKTNKPGIIYWAVTRYEDGRTSIDELIKPGKYNTEIKKNGSLPVESDKEYTVRITGLEINMEYILSAVLVDDRDDRSARKTANFTTMDNSKPGFLSGYPRIKSVTDVAAAIEYVTLKDSDMYWAVYEKGYPAPDAKGLKSQKLYGAVKNGIKTKCLKYEGGTLDISGLKELSSYDCYILLSDGTNESSVTRLSFNTSDATPPQFNLGYPKITATDKTSTEIGVSLNEEGLVYYAIYEGGTSFPVKERPDADAPLFTSDDAKQQVIKGKGAEKTGKSSNMKEDTVTLIKLSGLKPEGEYDVYFVAQDKSGNLSEIKKVSIEAKPDFITGYPRVQSIKNLSADIAVNVTKNCKAYWAILPKGSIAPTEVNLKAQVISGATNMGILEDCKKNEEKALTVSGLKEFAEYEFYILVTDGLTSSAVNKLEIQTADLTPPIFANGYPALDKVADKSLDVKFKVNENATIYYVLCKKGDTFPLPATPGGVQPTLDSDEAKNQVVLGNSGLKNGKVTAKQNTEGKISITGLAAETPYNLYIVAQDSFNNISNVIYMDVKTADFTAPKAVLEFEETISGDVVAGSEIRIKFSEEVVDNATKKKLSTLDKSELEKNITLYDLSALRRPVVPIDFSKVLVEDIDGKTVVTFPKGVLGLNSGNAYEFELNKIADTSGNRMDEKTLLPSFNTVAPMVEIMETVSSADLDMSFELTPQVTETNDNIFYDIVFQSNEKVGFEVYEKPKGSANFTKVTSGGKSVVIVEKGKSVSLQNIKDKIFSDPDEDNQYNYERFKDLKQTEYGIKIVSINGDTAKKGWSSTVIFGVKCIIGGSSALSPVSDNPTDRLVEAIGAGKVTVVNYPKDFSVKVYFTDTIIPEFSVGYPALVNAEGASKVGDTLIRPLVMVTKQSTFYYLIAKEGTVVNPTADGIMNGTYKPQDGVYGSFPIVSAETEYEFRIEGLKPNVNYVMYCFLKGTPAATSPMKEIKFTTVSVAPPKLDSAYIRDRLENSAIIDIALDKEADIDWIVFNKQSMPLETVINGDFIRKREENIAYRPIDFGSATAKISKGDTLARATITINNIERNVYYNFYAVAKSPAGGGDSTIIKVINITPADKTKPTVIADTVITNYGDIYAQTPYKGTLTLTFSEPMFYLPKEEAALKPLDVTVFKQGLEIGLAENEDSGNMKLEVISFKTASTDSGESALTSVTIRFSGIYNNSVINFPYALSDKNTNIAGFLYMKFVDKELEGGIRAKSYWTQQFIS
ncbi:S-layer homology domain-containing protein [Anaerotignum sp.]|uniref:S-layer homology domain-containing protein n=1 Tax=Anaerotignum sp. TaxID=2039241 RepID=UPI0028A04F73|nr:S-layer homology domain-containing protein [Anaerotignum sp.]